MAYSEKLLPVESLLAAWQNRSMREGNSSQDSMRNAAMQKQIEAQDLANKKAKLEMDLMTSPFNVNNYGRSGPESPYSIGYDKYASDREKERTMSMLTGNPIPALGIHGGYGGGGGGGTSAPSADEGRLAAAQADMAEEQVRMAAKERSGYGSATKDLMAQNQIEQQATQSEANRQNQMDIAKLYADTKQNVADTTSATDLAIASAKGETTQDRGLSTSAARNYKDNTAFKELDPAFQKKVTDTYVALNKNDAYDKFPADLQSFSTRELPNLLRDAGGRDLSVSEIIRILKDKYSKYQIENL